MAAVNCRYSRRLTAQGKVPLKRNLRKAKDSVSFDPKTFNVTERRGFDDLKVGEVYRNPSRTVTEAHFAAFQMLSGDNHPIHYDIEFCRAHGLRGMLAHGFQVLCLLARSAPAVSRT